MKALEKKTANFSLLTALRLVPPALQALTPSARRGIPGDRTGTLACRVFCCPGTSRPSSAGRPTIF